MGEGIGDRDRDWREVLLMGEQCVRKSCMRTGTLNGVGVSPGDDECGAVSRAHHIRPCRIIVLAHSARQGALERFKHARGSY